MKFVLHWAASVCNWWVKKLFPLIASDSEPIRARGIIVLISVHTIPYSERIKREFPLWRADSNSFGLVCRIHGYVWTEAESAKKKLRIQKYSDMGDGVWDKMIDKAFRSIQWDRIRYGYNFKIWPFHYFVVPTFFSWGQKPKNCHFQINFLVS